MTVPLILALDTTHEHGSLALVRGGGETIEEELLHEPQGFSRVLYARIEALLARHKLEPAVVDCFAAAAGPGSFTGVRIGLACIKGLAEALNKPAIAVSNLQALARFGTREHTAVVLDARREQVYGAVYDAHGALVSSEVVTKFAEWVVALPAGVTEFIADCDIDAPPGATVIRAPRAIAATVGHIAAERLAQGDTGDPAAIDANYVRRSDAELWSDKP